MQFTRKLREPIRRGEITCSVRLWQRPHVRVGGRYALPPGEIVVESLQEISLADVTPELARRSGFDGVIDLLKTAKHGRGRRVFLVEFRYVEPKVTIPWMKLEAARLLLAAVAGLRVNSAPRPRRLPGRPPPRSPRSGRHRPASA